MSDYALDVAVDASREVTVAEAAELTGLTKRAIARRIERGGLPAQRKQNGRRYVRIRDLAEAGLLDLAAGKPPPWRADQVDPKAVARELVQTLIRQGIELNELRLQLEALEDESRRQDANLLEQIEQARRERRELRAQIEQLSKRTT
jgi:excisionase family DNA binding protein